MKYLLSMLAMVFAISVNAAPSMADPDKSRFENSNKYKEMMKHENNRDKDRQKHYEKSNKYKTKQVKRDHGSDDKSSDSRDHASKASKSNTHAEYAKPEAARSSPYAERLKRAAEKRNRPTSR